MPLDYYTQDQAVPESGKQIAICYSADRKLAWLELSNFDFLLTNGCSDKIVTFLVGAVPADRSGWRLIDRRTADANRSQRVYVEADLGPKQVYQFQEAILKDWSGFRSARAADFAKGKTFGKSLTSPSFVAKALKTGYEAAGVVRSAYSGIKLSDWSVEDLLKYANHMCTPGQAAPGFTKYYPHPYFVKTEKKGESHGGTVPLLESQKPYAKIGYAYDDYFTKQGNEELTAGIPRVTAYGFRGDGRAPEALARNQQEMSAGGLWPNATRPGHIEDLKKKSETAREKLEQQQLHLGQHIKSQFYKGYVSVSKSPLVAKKFAPDGYVYALFVQGAFHVPEKGTHPYAIYNEQELAMPGGLDWEDVVGYRKTSSGMFTGPVYFKRDFFHDEDPKILTELYLLLSGKTPGTKNPPGATGTIF